MKKSISFILIAAIAVGFCGGFSALAEEVTDENGFVTEGTVLVDYVGEGGDIVIPDGITEIGERAFEGNRTITSVVISEDVNSISFSAFECCEALVSVDFPESEIYIQMGAFFMCTSLISIDFSVGCDVIDSLMFYGCESLTSVRIPDGVEYIADNAFGNCISLDSVNLPSSLTTIADYAFMNCISLATLIVPKSVTYIMDVNVFDPCTTLIVDKDSNAYGWAVLHNQPYVFSFVSSFNDIGDVFNILKLIVFDYPISAEQIAIADKDNSGTVTAADALILLKQVIGL